MNAYVKMIISAIFLTGCSAGQGGPVEEKNQARQELERMMAQGLEPAVDVCAERSWYGDGACDDWCGRRDADCPLPGPEEI